MFKDGLLRGRRILVTGGGTGLGKGMAEKFLALGAEVFICGRRKSVCDETAAAGRRKTVAGRAGDDRRLSERESSHDDGGQALPSRNRL